MPHYLNDTHSSISLQKTQLGNYKKLWNMILDKRQDKPDVISSDHLRHLEMVSEGYYAYMTDATTSHISMSQDCSLAVMQEPLYSDIYAIGVQNNSAYRNLLSYQ